MDRSLGPRFVLTTEIPPGLPPAQVDANQVELAILNLAINARDAMVEGGSIHISVREEQVTGNAVLPSGDFLAVAIADSGTELDAAMLLTLRAAWLKRGGLPFSHQASMAKLMASERAFAACNRVLAVMGADGQDVERPVERFFRDVRVTMIYEGTSEVQRIVIARDIARRFDDARGEAGR